MILGSDSTEELIMCECLQSVESMKRIRQNWEDVADNLWKLGRVAPYPTEQSVRISGDIESVLASHRFCIGEEIE